MTVGAQSPVSRETIESTLFSSGHDVTIDVDVSQQQHYSLALTGNAFSVVKSYYPELLSRILVRGLVFGRMSPDQKQQLVELLQSLGYFVGKQIFPVFCV